jgi:tetratricopeptide (TPR) repeat protein
LYLNPTTILGAVLIMLLQGCISAPKEEMEMREVDGSSGSAGAGTPVDVVSSDDPVPELKLNLERPDCECTPVQPQRDTTFLDRGFDALVQGDHIEAVQYFQRYQRLEKLPASAWEAGIAVAYISTMQHSPFYDPDAARKSYRRLQKEFRDSWQVDERILLLTMSLESFRVMYRHVDDLEDSNSTLREDLEKREEALKRLRELTLGQKATRP